MNFPEHGLFIRRYVLSAAGLIFKQLKFYLGQLWDHSPGRTNDWRRLLLSLRIHRLFKRMVLY